MFVAEKLVFTELHKTGGTHIGTWLDRLVGGEQIGKHNRVPHTYWDRKVIGSIRNPWDWYVSLWAYGCSKRGSVFVQTTRGLDIRYLREQLAPEMGFQSLPLVHGIRQAFEDIRRPVQRWRDVYTTPDDVSAFRRWLRMMYDYGRRYDVGEGYGFSPCSRWAGLLTYRYLKLFTKLGPRLYTESALADERQAIDLAEREVLVDYVIKNENLEEDLLAAIDMAGYSLSDEQRKEFWSRSKSHKTNVSKRLPTGHYYDGPTTQLVRQRESLVLSRHAYADPA